MYFIQDTDIITDIYIHILCMYSRRCLPFLHCLHVTLICLLHNNYILLYMIVLFILYLFNITKALYYVF